MRFESRCEWGFFFFVGAQHFCMQSPVNKHFHDHYTEIQLLFLDSSAVYVSTSFLSHFLQIIHKKHEQKQSNQHILGRKCCCSNHCPDSGRCDCPLHIKLYGTVKQRTKLYYSMDHMQQLSPHYKTTILQCRYQHLYLCGCVPSQHWLREFMTDKFKLERLSIRPPTDLTFQSITYTNNSLQISFVGPFPDRDSVSEIWQS